MFCVWTRRRVCLRVSIVHMCANPKMHATGIEQCWGGGSRKHVLFAACSPARGESYVTEGERGGKNAALKKKLPLSCWPMACSQSECVLHGAVVRSHYWRPVHWYCPVRWDVSASASGVSAWIQHDLCLIALQMMAMCLSNPEVIFVVVFKEHLLYKEHLMKPSCTSTRCILPL